MAELSGKTAIVTGAGSGIGARNCRLGALAGSTPFQYQDGMADTHLDAGEFVAIIVGSDAVCFFA